MSVLSPRPSDALDRWLRRWGLDAALAVAAVLVGVPSIAYPFGRDQGLHYYVGRYWLEGLVPYRDTFDTKPPGIHAVHALAVAIFGPHQHGVRILDLVAVLAVGVCGTAIARTQSAAPGVPAPRDPRGLLGASMVLSVAGYYTVFDFWDTAQAETWEALFLLVSVWAVLGLERRRTACLVAGLAFGGSLLFKPTAIVAAPAVALALMLRDSRAGEGGAARFAKGLAFTSVGATLIPLFVVAVFAGSGGLHDFWDVLIKFNGAVAQSWRLGWRDTATATGFFWLEHSRAWTAAAVVGVAFVVVRHRRAPKHPALVVLLLFALMFGSVILQGKLFIYHWVVALLILLALVTVAFNEAFETRPLHGVVVAVVVAGLAVVFAPLSPAALAHLEAPAQTTFGTVSRAFWRKSRGQMTRNAFYALFVGEASFDYLAQERIGLAIRRRARPGDRLVVAGFDPVLYQLSGLRSDTRFATDMPLWDPRMTYRKEEWTAEYMKVFRAAPPRFIVTSGSGHPVFGEAVGYRFIMAAPAMRLLMKE